MSTHSTYRLRTNSHDRPAASPLGMFDPDATPFAFRGPSEPPASAGAKRAKRAGTARPTIVNDDRDTFVSSTSSARRPGPAGLQAGLAAPRDVGRSLAGGSSVAKVEAERSVSGGALFNGRSFNVEAAYARLRNELPGLKNPAALKTALNAFGKAWGRGEATQKKLFVIDYSLPSSQRRGWVVDLARCEVKYHLKVAHGAGSGGHGASASRFSNASGSHATSLGAMVTGPHSRQSKFPGGKLILRGLEPGFNDQVGRRAVVMHGASYVASGGRSHGCPAVEPHLAVPVMKYLEGGALLFAYGKDQDWLRRSTYAN